MSDVNEEYLKRVKSMENSDFGMFTKDNINYDVINFENDNHYDVVLTNSGRIKYSCNCPDYYLRCRLLGIPCKHILFVSNYRDDYSQRSKDVVDSVMSTFKKGSELCEKL